MSRESITPFNPNGFGLLETLVSLGVVAVVAGIILSNVSSFFVWNSANIQRKKLDINRIADAYISKALDANAYSPLNDADFSNGKIPAPPDGTSYQGLLSKKEPFFKVCTPLDANDNSLNCIENENADKCYCRASQNADQFIAAAKSQTPDATSAPNPTPKACVPLKQLPPSIIRIHDSFDRSNSTASLGKTDTGHPWLLMRGIWGIRDSQAYPDTIIGNVENPANSFAVVDTGKSDGILEVTLSENVQDARIAFRVIDENNNYFVERNVLGYHIEKTVQGIRFELTPKVINTSFVDGDRIKVEMRGPCVYVYVNNSPVLQINDSTFTTGKHGFGTYQNKEVRFDNFSYRFP